MRHQIESFIEDICASSKKISTFGKASTKQAIVLKLLSMLEWDIFDVEQVCPDYSVDSYKVSYALLVNGNNKIFIEVKRCDEKIDNHQKSSVAFAAKEGVDLCVLTNGFEWRFYLISDEGERQLNWFHSIDFLKQKPDSIASQVIDLLKKDNVSNGQALKTAKAFYQNHKQETAAKIIPQAWNRIISEPNKILVELLSECTEKLCGHKVESDQIEKFVKKYLDKLLIKDMCNVSSASLDNIIVAAIPEEDPTVLASGADQVASIKRRGTYEGKVIKSFTFDGRTYEVRHWEKVLTALCNRFAKTHKKDFEKVLWKSGQYPTYFSRNEEDLHVPEKIKKTDIYVETKLSPDEIVKTARLLLTEFGYPPDMLMLTAE